MIRFFRPAHKIILNKHFWSLPSCLHTRTSGEGQAKALCVKKVMICYFAREKKEKPQLFTKYLVFYATYAQRCVGSFVHLVPPNDICERFTRKKPQRCFRLNASNIFFSVMLKTALKNSTELMEFVLSISCSSLPSFSTILFWIFHHNLDFISFIVVHAYIYIKPYSYIEERFPFTASYIGADMTTAPFRGCWNCL